MNNEHKSTAMMSSFLTGVFITMLINALSKIETIQTVDDAQRVYIHITIMAIGSIFMILFTLIEYEMSERPNQ